jgi:hypothetical protein
MAVLAVTKIRISRRPSSLQPAASAVVAGREPAKEARGFAAWWRGCCRHDVSILIATVGAVGRYRGARPRSKVSMMIMRPPQQGQGCASVGGSSTLSESLASLLGLGALGLRRSWASALLGSALLGFVLPRERFSPMTRSGHHQRASFSSRAGTSPRFCKPQWRFSPALADPVFLCGRFNWIDGASPGMLVA